jgi:hypothetical protein
MNYKQLFDYVGTEKISDVSISIPSRRRGIIGDLIFPLSGGKPSFVPVGTSIDKMISQGMPSSLPPIPSAVTKKLSYVETKLLYYNGTGEVHHSFPKGVYTQRRPLWTNAEQVQVLPPRLAKRKRLLYHGSNRRDVFYMSLGLGQRPFWGMNGHEFGPGLYFSFDPMIAKTYAGSGGVLITIDWTTEGAPLTKKILRGEEWAQQVKNYTCMETSNVPPQPFEEDFVIGPTSSNHRVIEGCGGPFPGNDVQVMARTPEACDYMSKNLVSVIWLE